jgi:hypothetical protein
MLLIEIPGCMVTTKANENQQQQPQINLTSGQDRLQIHCKIWIADI